MSGLEPGSTNTPLSEQLTVNPHPGWDSQMSSPQRFASFRAQRAVVSDPSLRRVRHNLRDQLLMMAFSALLSLGLASLLSLALATALQIGKP